MSQDGRDLVKPANEIQVGLRFRAKDAARLKSLADRVQLGEIGKQHVALFENAANAAQLNEPLVIRCVQLTEAELIAQAFINFGVVPTALEVFGGPQTA